MNKLEMAHQYAIALIGIPLCQEMDMDDFVTLVHDYADKMVDEYKSRQDKSRPEAIESNSVVVRDGGYYYDHVNFDYYKFIESQWYRLESILGDTWIKCSQPNLKLLIEDGPSIK